MTYISRFQGPFCFGQKCCQAILKIYDLQVQIAFVKQQINHSLFFAESVCNVKSLLSPRLTGTVSRDQCFKQVYEGVLYGKTVVRMTITWKKMHILDTGKSEAVVQSCGPSCTPTWKKMPMQRPQRQERLRQKMMQKRSSFSQEKNVRPTSSPVLLKISVLCIKNICMFTVKKLHKKVLAWKFQ